MSRAELIREISRRTGLVAADISVVMDAILDIIRNIAFKGGSLRLNRLGLFYIKKKRAHVGRNPKNGDLYDIPERGFLSFRPSPSLRKLEWDEAGNIRERTITIRKDV